MWFDWRHGRRQKYTLWGVKKHQNFFYHNFYNTWPILTSLLTILTKSIANNDTNTMRWKYCRYQYRYFCKRYWWYFYTNIFYIVVTSHTVFKSSICKTITLWNTTEEATSTARPLCGGCTADYIRPTYANAGLVQCFCLSSVVSRGNVLVSWYLWPKSIADTLSINPFHKYWQKLHQYLKNIGNKVSTILDTLILTSLDFDRNWYTVYWIN